MWRDLLFFVIGAASTLVILFAWGMWLVHRDELHWIGWRRRPWHNTRRRFR